MGPEKAVDAVRKSLQIGADSGVHVVDDAIAAPTTSAPPWCSPAGEIVTDEDGSGAGALVDFLASKKSSEEQPEMSEVLVVVDHADGEVKKPTYELLTIARRLGEPAAVFFGSPDQGDAVAEKVRRREGLRRRRRPDQGLPRCPKAEALQQLAEKTGPAAILLPSTFENKEVAGRLAIKLGSGLITDAVDVAAGSDGSAVTTQSVFAGNYTVQAKVTTGTPIITVKPNSAAPEEADGAGAVEALAATISDAAKTAQVVATQPRQSTGRPELTEAAIVVSGGRGTGPATATMTARFAGSRRRARRTRTPSELLKATLAQRPSRRSTGEITGDSSFAKLVEVFAGVDVEQGRLAVVGAHRAVPVRARRARAGSLTRVISLVDGSGCWEGVRSTT